MRFLSYPLAGAILLGAFGLVAGVVGPMIWEPRANQGPLIGILVTGPLGVIVGLVVGLVLAFLHRGPKSRA